MAKQKKTGRKIQMHRALGEARDYIVEKAAIIIVSFVFVILASLLIKAFLEKSDYFRLKSVDVRGAAESSLAQVKNDILRQYKDRNIFKVDLKAIAASLSPKYPDAKEILAKRALPDKIVVDLKFRKPVALLSAGQAYPIDREGVILVNINSMKLKDFPVIKGIDPRLAGKSRKRNESANLMIALSLLDEIKKARFLDKFGVRLIDAGDIKSLSFSLGDAGPIVIIGYEDFRERLNTLKDALRDPRLALDKINYIDVRFKDVAISPK